MTLNELTAISPLDGRYWSKDKELADYFSEYALIKYRILVEVEYFIALCELPLPQLADFDKRYFEGLRQIYQDFNTDYAVRVKEIEKTTNHDVKAIEYFLKEQFDELKLETYKEFIHFGLTSQDINNTALPLSMKEAIEFSYYPELDNVLEILVSQMNEWKDVSMLAKTHGQPASTTRLGKEIKVFYDRIENQLSLLKNIPYAAKFGGATGNFNAHHLAYPDIDWVRFANNFVNDTLGLHRVQTTTQIEHYDYLSATFDNLKRINTILIDMCCDFWLYISMDYFKQQIKAGEVGSSVMPHKVNPIDFENAEGNLGVANALFTHMAEKLPVSRLQRDLTDSTVSRNAGVPLGHTLISLKSIQRGLNKLIINNMAIKNDLDNNWVILSEAVQTVLRREGFANPYEIVKDLTRTNKTIDRQTFHDFIDGLNIRDEVKTELKQVTPQNYTGMDLV
jgi:adenylosuccinate lyase